MTYDVIIVGCGFAGAVIARKMAEEKGKKVLILEKRGHIAGNMFDTFNERGILVHQYGPHIFHTNSDEVMQYLRRFSDWSEYRHRVLGRIGGKLVPIPFNFTSLEALFPKESADLVKNKLATAFKDRPRVSVMDLLEAEDEDISRFGQFVYDNVFANYTAKQWGVPASKVDRSVINRVPVVLGREDTYFADRFQCMPRLGYYRLFKNMLAYPNIMVELGVDANQRLTFNEAGEIRFDGEKVECPVVYTGPIDGLCNYRFGELPYRSLEMVFESYDLETYQPAAVVNYPNDQEYTRITEFKHMTGQRVGSKTTIMKEYPRQYDRSSSEGSTPYYPIVNPHNLEVYNRYVRQLSRYHNVYLCGRLAEYRYYNMDAVVARAFEVYEQICDNRLYN